MKSMLDAMPTPVVMVSRDYTVNFMNAAAAVHAGLASPGRGQQCSYEIFHGSDTPCEAFDTPCPARDVFLTGRPAHAYFRHVSRGSSNILEVTASPLFDEHGKVENVIEVMHSLDGNELAARLTASEERFQGLVETSPDAIVMIDEQGIILFANAATSKILGYETSELIGKPAALLAPERLAADFFSADWRPLPSQFGAIVGKTTESIGLRKDGLEIPVEVSLSGWASGNAARYTAIIRDITDRKRAQVDLLVSRDAIMKEHEELARLFRFVDAGKREWELTMDCIQDMVILMDAQGAVRRCNRTFKDFVGKTYDEVLGRDCRALLADRSLTLPEAFVGDVNASNASGSRWFRISVYPLRDNSGSITSGSVMTIHDLTQIKRVTQKLEQTNAEIEKAYTELKQTQAKVLQQEKMASIGQIAAGVAHEINNPIGFMSSNLNTLQKYVLKIIEYFGVSNELAAQATEEAGTKLAEARKRLKMDYVIDDVQKLISESQDGAERVRTIVQNLKSFARVDQADARLANINDCIESTLNIVWNELKYKAIVKKEYGDIPQTPCFPQQLNQVFMNLFVNAAHAIEKQGTITVRTWTENGSILASISDTGRGIPQENLTRIFEPFFTTKCPGKGTGLGLSITYDIVKKHNGEITVQSEPGRGTTFVVRIPIKGDSCHA
ncbi:MAG TPA: PAS domain S-box protein [Nitrospirota bacterium]|nr:PAS domain S-box protein [Nitrospirota bacterium]